MGGVPRQRWEAPAAVSRAAARQVIVLMKRDGSQQQELDVAVQKRAHGASFFCILMNDWRNGLTLFLLA